MGNLSTSSWEGYLFLIDNTQLPAFVLVFFPAEVLAVHKNNGARNKPHSLRFSSIGFVFLYVLQRETSWEPPATCCNWALCFFEGPNIIILFCKMGLGLPE